MSEEIAAARTDLLARRARREALVERKRAAEAQVHALEEQCSSLDNDLAMAGTRLEKAQAAEVIRAQNDVVRLEQELAVLRAELTRVALAAKGDLENAQTRILEQQQQCSAAEAAAEQMRQALLRATEEKMVSTAKAQDDAAAAEARAIDAEEVADKLRDAIRRLTEDKFKLFSRQEMIAAAAARVKDMAAARWQDDSSVDCCLSCRVEFSLFLRRHHCRLCGRIFCGTCTSKRMELAASAVKERVCDECHEAMSTTLSGILSEDADMSTLNVTGGPSLMNTSAGVFDDGSFDGNPVHKGWSNNFDVTSVEKRKTAAPDQSISESSAALEPLSPISMQRSEGSFLDETNPDSDSYQSNPASRIIEGVGSINDPEKDKMEFSRVALGVKVRIGAEVTIPDLYARATELRVSRDRWANFVEECYIAGTGGEPL